MKSKSLFFIRLLAILLCAVTVSCQEENSEPDPLPYIEPEYTINTDHINASHHGGTYWVELETNVEWEMKVEGYDDEASWCTLGDNNSNTISGTSGHYSIKVCVSENHSFEYRSATIDLYLCGNNYDSDNIYIGQEYKPYEDPVDLGLSVKWASWNIGAFSPEDEGSFYAWGETEWHKSDYTWETYKWCKGSEDTMTKYCTDNYWGTVDNKTKLDPEDDVAHVKWGDGWRMPTMQEFEELLDECDWRWLSVNGIYGYRVTGPNGNSIFLPAAGYCYGEGHAIPAFPKSEGYIGDYWSATLFDDSDCAYILEFNNKGNFILNCSNRYFGHTVRPVKD